METTVGRAYPARLLEAFLQGLSGTVQPDREVVL